MPRLAPSEVHNPTRQRVLVDRAMYEAERLATDDAVLAVWLTGSVARGPVDSGSDLDLHVVLDRGTRRVFPPWRFQDGGVVLNVHTVPIQVLERGLSARQKPAVLARWMYATALGDELQGARNLFCRSEHAWIVDASQGLAASRLSAPIVVRIASLHEGAARLGAVGAARDVASGLVREAHHSLRVAAQYALVGSLIRCGWTIRGSKKRPEIASAYSDETRVAKALVLLEGIVGLAGVTERAAQRLCEQRLSVRRLVVEELAEVALDSTQRRPVLGRVRRELRFQERHNEGAIDYYRPLIDAGFLRGPVNHMRALSGFATLPARRAKYLCHVGRGVITSWLAERAGSSDLRETWLAIAMLSASPREVSSWAADLERFVTFEVLA